MPDFDTPPVTETSPLPEDLLHFYDSYTEFHDYCAFLCDAWAGMANDRDQLDEDTLRGLRHFAMEVKHRSSTLKTALNLICNKSRSGMKKPHGEKTTVGNNGR